MPNPLDLLRDMFQNRAQEADTQSRQKAQHWDGSFKFPKNLPPHMVYMGEDLPPVSRAPMFRPQTEVVGGPEFARTVDTLLTQVPEMRGRSPQIVHGPTDSVFDLLRHSGFDDNDYPRTSLNGLMEIGSKRISLNPRLKPMGDQKAFNLEGTLAHELGHTVGAEHGIEMDDIKGSTIDGLKSFLIRKR